MKTSIAILVIKKQHVIFKQDGGAGDMVKKKKFEAPNEVMISALKTVSNKYCNYIHIYIYNTNYIYNQRTTGGVCWISNIHV